MCLNINHVDYRYMVFLALKYMGLLQQCREDNIILETMIVTTIKKIDKLLILKAKFKEINQII